jgi:Asp/Glu/hydantoin racemase
MTTVGIVGGLGPESTIDYYRRILEAWERIDSSTAPSIVIDRRRALHLVGTDRAALTEYLLSSLRRLSGAEADFAAMTANTRHIVFDALAARSPSRWSASSRCVPRKRDGADWVAWRFLGRGLPWKRPSTPRCAHGTALSC